MEQQYKKKLHEIKSRSGYMVREIQIMGDKICVGRHVVLPTITYNHNKQTETIQGKMLQKIYNTPPSTSY